MAKLAEALFEEKGSRQVGCREIDDRLLTEVKAEY